MKQLSLLLLFFLSTGVMANEKIFSVQSIAIRGYDSVAFFTQNAALKGKPELQFKWQGVTWLFSSEKNRHLFEQSPEKYAPQFGGYCALGAAHLGAVPTNPEAFSIHEGKLYFNMTDEVRITWQLNAEFHIQRAQRAWSEGKITFY